LLGVNFLFSYADRANYLADEFVGGCNDDPFYLACQRYVLAPLPYGDDREKVEG
jgi:hypothetical protein